MQASIHRHGRLRYHCVAFVRDRSALLKKKGPLAGPLRKWRMFRPPLSLWEENGVLRTCPLKRSGGLVTSKLAVNLLVADAPLQDSRDRRVLFWARAKKGETMDNLELDRSAFAKGIPLLAVVLIGMALTISFFL